MIDTQRRIIPGFIMFYGIIMFPFKVPIVLVGRLLLAKGYGHAVIVVNIGTALVAPRCRRVLWPVREHVPTRYLDIAQISKSNGLSSAAAPEARNELAFSMSHKSKGTDKRLIKCLV